MLQKELGMYVNAPKRTTNGGTVAQISNDCSWANGSDFSTIGAAVAQTLTPSIISGSKAITGYRERQFMQTGVVGFKSYKPTNYVSHALSIVYKKRDTVSVDQTRVVPSPLYRKTYRKYGYGFTGGQGTGLGSPWNEFSKNFRINSIAANANYAIILNAENRAKVEAINKGRNQKLDLSESLVDVDKSVMMVARRASQVITAWSQVRKGNLREAMLTLGLTPRSLNSKTLSQVWLELNYGWMPLLSDIESGMKVANEGLGLPTSVFTVSRRVIDSLTGIGMTYGLPSYLTGKMDIYSRVDVVVKHRLRIKDATLAYLSALGVDNPAYLVWVGLPFTFVVDWMMPVSDWLQALSAPLGLDYVNGYMTTHIESVIDTKIEAFSPTLVPSNVRYKEEPFEAQLRFVELDREAFTSFPTVLPYFRFPFSNPKRIVTAVALLEQMRKH